MPTDHSTGSAFEGGKSCKSFATALLGRAIGGSASPAIHEREARHLDLPLTYRLADFDALGLGDDELGSMLDLFVKMGFAGVNVTYPFKQLVVPMLDEIDATASQVGAVNTIQFDAGRKLGFNTDVSGFQWLMKCDLPNADLTKVAQIGAGGAGSATCFALLSMGAKEIAFYDKDPLRSEQLIARHSSAFPEVRFSLCHSAADALENATGIVQTTPVGMNSHPGKPFDVLLLDPMQWLVDVIYVPRETELVQAAVRMGLRAVGGTSMVIGQAAEAFRLFTGSSPDMSRMARDLQADDRA